MKSGIDWSEQPVEGTQLTKAEMIELVRQLPPDHRLHEYYPEASKVGDVK
jgi:hypothetical protein